MSVSREGMSTVVLDSAIVKFVDDRRVATACEDVVAVTDYRVSVAVLVSGPFGRTAERFDSVWLFGSTALWADVQHSVANACRRQDYGHCRVQNTPPRSSCCSPQWLPRRLSSPGIVVVAWLAGVQWCVDVCCLPLAVCLSVCLPVQSGVLKWATRLPRAVNDPLVSTVVDVLVDSAAEFAYVVMSDRTVVCLTMKVSTGAQSCASCLD